MTHEPTRWLLISAALEILLSSLLGYLMLIPMQPWGKRLRERWPSAKSLMSVHLDLVMLGLMQLGAAAGLSVLPGRRDRLVAILMVAGGWLNVTPYIWRLLGVNAFALAGGRLQRFAASVSFASTVALTAAWGMLLFSWASEAR